MGITGVQVMEGKTLYQEDRPLVTPCPEQVTLEVGQVIPGTYLPKGQETVLEKVSNISLLFKTSYRPMSGSNI